MRGPGTMRRSRRLRRVSTGLGEADRDGKALEGRVALEAG
jgi:hypothetical protein